MPRWQLRSIIFLVIAHELSLRKKDQIRMKNYYEILEVERDAPQDQIKEQYLFLIQAWHPDKFSNPAQKVKAEEKTKDINAAYEILRNPLKRAEYDRRNRSSRSTQKQEYRRQEQAQAAQRRAEDERHKREEQLQKERADTKRAAAAPARLRVFMNGQERMLSVGELVKATVQYLDGETKEDMGVDYFRTHAAVRAPASRCLKCGVEIHVRQLAR
jgi:curved DNA-binding protein CbpA